MSQVISRRQLAFLQFTTIAPTILVFLPGAILAGAGHDGPFVVLAALAEAAGVDAVLVAALVPSSPPQLFRQAWGDLGGRLATAGYALGLGLGLVAVWAEFLILIRTEVLPLTPEWAVAALGVLVTGLMASRGPAGIARVNDLVVATTTLVMVALVAVAAGGIETWNLLPPYPLAWTRLWGLAWLPVTFLGEIPVAATFLPRVRDRAPRALRAALLLGAGAAGLALLAPVVVTLGVLGPVLAREIPWPFFEVVADLRIGQFLTKNALWLIAVGSLLLYVKIAIWSYAVADSCRAAARRGTRRVWIWAVVPVTAAVAVHAFTATAAAQDLVAADWAEGVFPFLAVLVTAAGVVRRWRRR
ncbi:MAG: GerAB/ArcD/ProY family transporter [Actinomycetia bacterium]|nr:GerAB/ArcD/ProY family transporter [Actinomycetes bacterium]